MPAGGNIQNFQGGLPVIPQKNTTATPTPGQTSQDYTSFMEGILPGIGQANQTGMGVIQDLLQGLPSVDQSRQANAYFGQGSGMGAGSDFLRNRGYDLYGQQAAARQQQGLGDLTQFMAGVSGPALQYRGQDLNQQLGLRGQDITQQLGLGDLGIRQQQLGQQGDQFTQSQAQQAQQYAQGQAQQQNQFNQNLGYNQWLSGQQLGLQGAGLGIQAAGLGQNALNSYLQYLQ
jgi:hypothetical protein